MSRPKPSPETVSFDREAETPAAIPLLPPEALPPRPARFKIITNGGTLITWKDQAPGFALEGIWLGVRSTGGKYEDPGAIQQSDGTELRFARPATLQPELDRIPTGTWIRIQYDGRVRGKTNTYHTFTVAVDEAVEVQDRADDKVAF